MGLFNGQQKRSRFYSQALEWMRNIYMGGSTKSQKACRLLTSEAKFAKKPATNRDNVMMLLISVHKIIYESFPNISTVLPILTSIPQIPAKKKMKKTEEMKKILPTRVANASNVILCPISPDSYLLYLKTKVTRSVLF